VNDFDVESGRKSRGRPRAWHDKTEQNTIKSLDRAMEVFDFLSTSQGLSLSELADALNQSPATIYRILVTLELRRLVEFDASQQIWNIGPHAFVIGARYLRRTSLVERARPVLRKLMEATGETANLAVEKENQVLFLSQVETSATIRAFFPPGTLSQMHASGIGKAILAYMDDARLERFLNSASLEGFTPSTIISMTALKEELVDIRTRGYSIDDEEKNVGMRCIAAPVFDMNREVIAGISVSGPTSRIPPELTLDLVDAVIDAGRDLTKAIGGEGLGDG